MQPAFGVEHVEEREEVVLVGATPMEEDKRAFCLAVRRPFADGHARAARGFGSGARICSTCSR